MTPPRGHPKGLYVLFFSEAWERFSFYGMRALLVLYLVDHVRLERARALEVYATYCFLVYLTPVIGGYLADKLLGARKAILIGGIVMALGHLAMAFEPLLYPALGLIIAGNGFFKPNISTIVGGLYEQGDPRRDAGFTIFYMGINLGAFLAPIVCGTLGEKVGWHWGFSAAAVGMVLGLLVFAMGQRLIGRTGFPPHFTEVTEKTRLGPRDWRDVALFSAGATALVFAVIALWNAAEPVLVATPWYGKTALVLAFVGAGVFGFRARDKQRGAARQPLTSVEIQQISALVVITVLVFFFWMGFEQAGGTMNLFAKEQTDRVVLGWEIPASMFQAINPLAILIFAPFLSVFWTRLDQSKNAISTPSKMALGLIILGLGFVVMYIGQQQAVDGLLISPLWLVSVYLIHTVGELCLSPIGLSLVTKLSPGRMVSLMMGLWFAITASADYAAGRLEELMTHFGLPLFGVLIATSVGAGVVLLALNPLLNRWMHGRG